MNNKIVVTASAAFLLGAVIGDLFQPIQYAAKPSSNDQIEPPSNARVHKNERNITLRSVDEPDKENPFSTESDQILGESAQAINPSLSEISDLVEPSELDGAQLLINELSLASNWNDLDILDIEDIAESETVFLEAIERSPELVKPLLSIYEGLSEDSTKDLLRSMLAASGAPEVENYALSALSTSGNESQAQWLYMLASTGVSSATSRQTLLSTIDGMANPQHIKTALQAFSPDVVSEEEQFAISNRLEVFTHHSDEEVRGAAVEALSKWIDKSNSQFIESALNDESEIVRRSAVFSSYTSGIKSDSIKNNLMRMLGDESQPYDLRIDVFNTLSTYRLQGDERRAYIRFNRELEATTNNIKSAKG